LRDIDVREVVQSVRETDKHNIAFAALFVALGYFTLTFYDLFALRTIGRDDVPYRIAALAGFTSMRLATTWCQRVQWRCGALRIYSAWGLDAIACR